MVISGAIDVTAEIMVETTWSYIAPLPSKRAYFPGATLNNVVSVFGKYNLSSFTMIKCM